MASRRVTRPTSAYVKAEHRFWSLIEEDLELIIADELAGRTPRQDRRIQLLTHDEPEVRISWRTQPNWLDNPILLLDASANSTILERCFGGRKIRMYSCESEANIRVAAFPDQRFAVSRLLGRSQEIDKLDTAFGLLKVRRLINTISAAHSHGRVAVCMTKPVREVICCDWVPPANADFMHDGATAGLDFAKDHVALISFGRTELPIWTIDGLVDALTYDMESRPERLDYIGSGRDGRNKAILPTRQNRALRLRTGQVAICQHQAHAGTYARAVQEQAREEAIRQRIGRIRGIYRETRAAVYLIGEAMPDDVIIDDLHSCDDLLGFEILDAARRIDGILSPEMIAKIAPDEWTVASAEKAIAKLGDRILRNFRVIHWIDADGGLCCAHVPAHFDDAHTEATFVRNARKLGLKGRVTAGTMRVPAVHAHAPRPVDAVETALGTIDERREAEEDLRRELIDIAIGFGEYRPAAMCLLEKNSPKYRISATAEARGEVGQIQLYRILTHQRKEPEERGIDAKLGRVLQAAQVEIRKAG